MAGLAEASYKKFESVLKEKHIPIRVHPCPFAVKNARLSENGRLGAENRDFWSETARKRRFQAGFDHFSPARPVAARFR